MISQAVNCLHENFKKRGANASKNVCPIGCTSPHPHPTTARYYPMGGRVGVWAGAELTKKSQLQTPVSDQKPKQNQTHAHHLRDRQSLTE